MCISDNTSSISTEFGNLTTVELSQSVFSSLKPHPWRPVGAAPSVNCAQFYLSESVQTKDRLNECVDFVYLFVGSGSSASPNQPHTKIDTDDGFSFSCSPQQEILRWLGGGTSQNQYIYAWQLVPGVKLVSWLNDVYQFVTVTSITTGPYDGIAVDWITTGTNSYQLENGMVLRGQVSNYCSCGPSASIQGIPCNSTLSFCVSNSATIGGMDIFTESFIGFGPLLLSGSTSILGSEPLWYQVPDVPPFPVGMNTNADLIPGAVTNVTLSFSASALPYEMNICYQESILVNSLQMTSSCCFLLQLNKGPSWNGSSSICQQDYGTATNLAYVFGAEHYDTINYDCDDAGAFVSVIDGPDMFIADPATHALGSTVISFTASVSNSLCFNSASGQPSMSAPQVPTVTYTPNCCPDISGSTTVWFNPGIDAGVNDVQCYPTISMQGFGPIYSFPLAGPPTWSVAGADLDSGQTVIDWQCTTVPGKALGPYFSPVINFRDSHSLNSEAYLTHPTFSGMWTMSLCITNGDCDFSDTVYIKVVSASANAGEDMTQCSKGTDYAMHATGSGFWTYVEPSVPLTSPIFSNIYVLTDPVSPFMQADCTTATYQWNVVSSSQHTIVSTSYTVTCTDTDTVNMTVEPDPSPGVFVGAPYVVGDCGTCETSVSFAGSWSGLAENAVFTVENTADEGWDTSRNNGMNAGFSGSYDEIVVGGLGGYINNSGSHNFLGGIRISSSQHMVTTVPNVSTSYYFMTSSNTASYGQPMPVFLRTTGCGGPDSTCTSSAQTTVTFNIPVASMSFFSASGEFPLHHNQDHANNSASIITYYDVVAMSFQSGSWQTAHTQSTVVSVHDNAPAPFISGAFCHQMDGLIDIRPPMMSYDHSGSCSAAAPVHGPYPNWPNTTIKPPPVANSGLSNTGTGLTFRWKAREIAIYGHHADELTHGATNVPDLVTGSFTDTMTSESFVECPTFFPAHRRVPGLPTMLGWSSSNVHNNIAHTPYVGHPQGHGETVLSQSTRFEVTASYDSCPTVFSTSIDIMFIYDTS